MDYLFFFLIAPSRLLQVSQATSAEFTKQARNPVYTRMYWSNNPDN